MTQEFDKDDHPGAPRILFVGWADSSHTHAWIDLIRDHCNVRLYAMPRGFPPDDWPVRTYITQSTPRNFDKSLRRRLYCGNTLDRDVRNWLVRRFHGQHIDAPRLGLAKVISRWRPHVIHALGLDPAGWFVLETRKHFKLHGMATWVLQLRGGSDLALRIADPALKSDLARDLHQFDLLLTDNLLNIDIIRELGLPTDRLPTLAPVPGSGGLDLESMQGLRNGPSSTRPDVIWPKAYECPWSKSLPVLEALNMCKDKLQGRTIFMLATDEETRAWHQHLPLSLRQNCVMHERIPRQELLKIMGHCRVMLAPSLVDGMPNSLYEAMALGTFPIVSPLRTITPMVREPENTLFARNLYPEEIAKALIRALEDDTLVDTAAEQNLKLVARLADRGRIAQEAVRMYEGLATEC